ncbi:PAS domain-containing protein [Polymorphum gilvum]|uniref:PAS domain-containing protein n=1 Tax=Polymorphum gilvum (strain LMG 25793 / CGMCC 1.9160 / SL003B-26A1) TaxID=991905 RepID=F2J0K9_POLGS|nr:PAS domain-containing protein [Polymorphum gilvum]ADZ69676.1 hypothetical protein SL003B_1248 [Polymorphum gilvum SL003B-26A1]
MNVKANARMAATADIEKDAPATTAAAEGGTEPGPALRLAGLHFFLADVNAKTLMWLETGSLSFEGTGGRLLAAPFGDAMRLLTPQDQKNILSLIHGAIRKGKAGPLEVGMGLQNGPSGMSLASYRHETDAGQTFVVCYPMLDGSERDVGSIVRGLAPIIRHFVENSNRAVLTIDNYGYIRYASSGFFQTFQIEDPSLCLGRNIAHIPKRVGKTLTSLVLTSLARRANASGRGRFQLPKGDTVNLNYNVMYFRISETIGGVLFSAEPGEGSHTDFARVFDLFSTAALVIDTKTRKIVAANKAARKAYQLTQQVMDDQPVTETLLHPRSYATLLDAAKKGTGVPQSVVVNSLDGVSKNKRLRAVLFEEDEESPKLLLEAKA